MKRESSYRHKSSLFACLQKLSAGKRKFFVAGTFRARQHVHGLRCCLAGGPSPQNPPSLLDLESLVASRGKLPQKITDQNCLHMTNMSDKLTNPTRFSEEFPWCGGFTVIPLATLLVVPRRKTRGFRKSPSQIFVLIVQTLS